MPTIKKFHINFDIDLSTVDRLLSRRIGGVFFIHIIHLPGLRSTRCFTASCECVVIYTALCACCNFRKAQSKVL